MDKLFYRIADHLICLHTPQAEVTRAMLPNYTPFEVGSPRGDQKVLLNVFGGCTCCEETTDELLEEVQDVAYHSHVYRKADGAIRIVMRYQGIEEIGCFSDDWHTLHCTSPLDTPKARYLIDRFTMIAFSILTGRLGMLKVHASVTELEGRALVFMGVSGTGKSTHSRLWRQLVPGATLLNDDEPIVRLMPDGSVRVYGCPWSGSTPCYRSVSAEVAAFVHLYQASENKLTKLSGREAFYSLYSSTAFMLSDQKSRFAAFNIVADVLERIPLYRLDCRPDEEAVSLTRSLLK